MTHVPTVSEYYLIIIGFSVLILICLALFIQMLRNGLDTRSSVVVDPKPGQSEMVSEKKYIKKETIN